MGLEIKRMGGKFQEKRKKDIFEVRFKTTINVNQGEKLGLKFEKKKRKKTYFFTQNKMTIFHLCSKLLGPLDSFLGIFQRLYC